MQEHVLRPCCIHEMLWGRRLLSMDNHGKLLHPLTNGTHALSSYVKNIHRAYSLNMVLYAACVMVELLFFPLSVDMPCSMGAPAKSCTRKAITILVLAGCS